MKEKYAEVLESYIIPAEEGFLVGTAAIVGGVTILSLLSSAVTKHKLVKKIRNNAGNPADYGSDIYSILRKYSHDITGILEPVNKTTYLKAYKKLVNTIKEAEDIRTQFCKIDLEDKEATAKYKKLNTRIFYLEKNVKSIYNEINNIDLSTLATNQVSLNASILKELNDIDFSIQQICWNGGHDGESLIMTEDFYFNDWSSDLYDIEDANECIKNFDSLMDYIMYDDDGYGDMREITRTYIRKCKFAINPNSKLNKK